VLHQRHNRIILTEPYRLLLKWFFQKSASLIDEIGEDIARNKFRIDLLVFDPADANLSSPRLRVIMELKMNPNPLIVKPDIQRTKRLLTALRNEPQSEEGSRFGYQLICWTEPSRLVDISVKNMVNVGIDEGLASTHITTEVFDLPTILPRRCGIVAMVI
jgi:hypothetical protein